jgi:hypothetical protein
MRLRCDTCNQIVEVTNPNCIACANWADDEGYCYFYETKLYGKDPKTYSCYGFSTTCECEGTMETTRDCL